MPSSAGILGPAFAKATAWQGFWALIVVWQPEEQSVCRGDYEKSGVISDPLNDRM
jgi:hypothetical protein